VRVCMCRRAHACHTPARPHARVFAKARKAALASAGELERARARAAELEAEVGRGGQHNRSEEEVTELRRLVGDRDREIERLEDIVHRECLERTDLLARIRELERG
jgi:hypothetical protein